MLYFHKFHEAFQFTSEQSETNFLTAHRVFIFSLFVFLTQQQRLNCVDVIISMRSASAAARTPVDCSELHQQPVGAVLRLTFGQKLCYKLL